MKICRMLKERKFSCDKFVKSGYLYTGEVRL